MPERDESVASIEALVGMLDRFEAAQDGIKAAFAAKREVEQEIKDALGIVQSYTADDKITAALLRALVAARKNERAGATDA